MEQSLLKVWIEEEKIAKIKGWDFSHLDGRWTDNSETLPWDYRTVVLKYLKSEMKILDIDTGGGEMLLSFCHPAENVCVTDGYKPNFEFCKSKLSPLGITVKEGTADSLPYDNESFDIVLNRHGDLSPAEANRVLKKGGLFITQQVGAENDREFVKLLIPEAKIPFPDQYLKVQTERFKNTGFEITEQNESSYTIRFLDVGALVWFAKIIEWEFIGFSVDTCKQQLFEAQAILSEEGFIEGKAHRFYFVAKKK